MYQFVNNINLAVVLPLITLFVFGVSLVLSLIMKRSKLEHSHFYTFIQIAGPMSVLFISVNMFIDGINIELTRKEQKFEVYQESIDKLYITVEKEIMEMYTMPMAYGVEGWIIRPEVYSSLYSSDLELYEITKDLNTKQTSQSLSGEKYVYIRILQAFEDYLQYQKMWDISDPAWLAVFIQWGQSKYLQKHFEYHQSNYSQSTVDFTKLIFEYGKDIAIPNRDPEIYIKIGEKLHSDERLVAIQNSVKEE
jgi:hypothetical protein